MAGRSTMAGSNKEGMINITEMYKKKCVILLMLKLY